MSFFFLLLRVVVVVVDRLLLLLFDCFFDFTPSRPLSLLFHPGTRSHLAEKVSDFRLRGDGLEGRGGRRREAPDLGEGRERGAHRLRTSISFFLLLLLSSLSLSLFLSTETEGRASFFLREDRRKVRVKL